MYSLSISTRDWWLCMALMCCTHVLPILVQLLLHGGGRIQARTIGTGIAAVQTTELEALHPACWRAWRLPGWATASADHGAPRRGLRLCLNPAVLS